MNVSAATIQYKVEAPSRTFTSCSSLTQITHDPLLSTTAGSVHRSIHRDLGLRMGSVFSRAKIILGAVFLLNKALDTLNKRLKESPGLPVPNPTTPLWTIPKAPISSEGKALPSYADVIVIGSGITGASVAYHALKRDAGLRVVIVEAREVCSGATGRCVG